MNVSNERDSRILAETNALSLGWHVGFYQFTLAIAQKDDVETLQAPSSSGQSSIKLRSEDQQVFDLILSTINALTKFFNLDAQFTCPKSREEARHAFANLERSERSKSGSQFIDILTTHYGREVAELYALGRKLMPYALVSGRKEPETQLESSRLASGIRDASQALAIPSPLIQDYLSHPERLSNRMVVEEMMSARKKATDQQPVSPSMTIPSWFAKAGFAAAGVAFLFLVTLVIMAMFGKDVPSAARVLVDIATAIAIACAFTFIGGTAQAEGKLPFFKGHEPIRFATTGGIAVFVIVLGLLLWSYR